MKNFLLTLLFFISTSVFADVYVNGYYRSDGTYVQPHYRSDPDGNIYNNWSTKGNVNPYTGKRGTVDPYKIEPIQPPTLNTEGLGVWEPIRSLYDN
jgi:hypothetical protein